MLLDIKLAKLRGHDEPQVYRYYYEGFFNFFFLPNLEMCLPYSHIVN